LDILGQTIEAEYNRKIMLREDLDCFFRNQTSVGGNGISGLFLGLLVYVVQEG